MTLQDVIEDYFKFIQHEQRVTQAMLETYKSWLRHFHRWLEANGYPNMGEFLITNGVLDANPAKSVTMPKMDAAERKTISDVEIAALLQACERPRIPRQIALSRAMLGVFVYGGLRRTECCDLRVEDVDTDTVHTPRQARRTRPASAPHRLLTVSSAKIQVPAENR